MLLLQRQSKEVNIGQNVLSVEQNVKQVLGEHLGTLKQDINAQNADINSMQLMINYNPQITMCLTLCENTDEMKEHLHKALLSYTKYSDNPIYKDTLKELGWDIE